MLKPQLCLDVVYGFVSAPLTVHFSTKFNFSISISLDSIIWGIYHASSNQFIKKNLKKLKKKVCKNKYINMSIFNAIPFVILLISVAVGPAVLKERWNRVFVPLIAILFLFEIFMYSFVFQEFCTIIQALYEYVQFIILIATLYFVTAGIEIRVNIRGNAFINTMILFIGGICANIFGTTGSAMLFINPFLKINKGRLAQYHIAFFIFIVCNIGGSLLPIGDPPLYIGFIKGIPFSWTLIHNFIPWIITTSILLTIFFFLDTKNKEESQMIIETKERKVLIKGYFNLILLFIVIGSLFINKNFIPSLPSFNLLGHEICLVRELILTSVLVVAYIFNNKETLKANNFSHEPIQELAILFLGIFITMAPVICIIEEYVKTINQSYITPSLLFWATGLFSSVLDNAPTYLNMLTASMTSNNFNINDLSHVIEYAKTATCIPALSAISIAAIFFGSITYISNGPNFMIKKIAEKNDIKMPSFFAFVLRYSLPILIGPFILIWFFFYR